MPTSLAPAARVGLDALRANPLRTLLSTLGIIGVASLVAVLALGDGGRDERAARLGGRAHARDRRAPRGGATRRDVLVRFLAEAVAVAGVGSVAGTLLGVAGAFGVTAAVRAYSSTFAPGSPRRACSRPWG